MAFVLKKVSNYGANHPVVARLVIQTDDIIQFFPISDSKKDEIKDVYYKKLQLRVLECTEIAGQIGKEVEDIKRDVEANDLRSQSHGRVIDVPQITRLEERSESFLYNAKSTLRDLSDVFAILFGKKFGHSKYNEILAWAEQELGKQSPMATFLAKEVVWIKYVVDLRNSVEHPENKRRGPLVIQNFELFEERPSGERKIREPTWCFKGINRASIRIDMDSLAHNMLTFAEDLLVIAHVQLEPDSIVKFAEIPESDREQSCPKRIRAVLDKSKIDLSRSK